MTEVIVYRDFEYFFCPLTGQQVIQPDDFTPSPATAFVFLHADRSFAYLSDELQKDHAALFDDENRHGELYLKLTEEDLKDCDYIWITTSDRYHAVSWCFNTNYEFQEVEEE